MSTTDASRATAAGRPKPRIKTRPASKLNGKDVLAEATTKPTALAPLFDRIPEELRARRAFLVWRYEWLPDTEKWTKVPYCAYSPGRHASTTDPSTWSSFKTACRTFERGNFDGIGIVLVDDLVGVDLDHVVDAKGNVEAWAAEALDHFGAAAYIERSPGGDGVHVFCRGKPQRCGKGGPENRLEIYAEGSPRYLTITGHGAGEVIEAQPALDRTHERHMLKEKPPAVMPSKSSPPMSDDEVLQRARAAKNGAKFDALWAGQGDPTRGDQSASSDDAALASMLAFWSPSASQIERLMRRSALVRDKWDTHRTYLARTIANALALPGERFQPEPPQSSPDDGDPLDAFAQWTVTPAYVKDISDTTMIHAIVAASHMAAWVGPAGSAKTMIANHIAGLLSAAGYRVLYFQEDMAQGDLPAAQAHAQAHGYQLLNSSVALGTGTDDQLDMLRALADSGKDLSHAVLFFDTAKKWLDLMSKSSARDFYKLVRALTAKGATIILLAHTNKHRGVDGKPIFEGVGDTRNDVDELLYFQATSPDITGDMAVTVERDKSRCAMPEAVSFDCNVQSRRVRQLEQPIDVAAIVERARQDEEDAPALVLFKQALLDNGGSMNSTVLISEVSRQTSTMSSRQVLAAFERHCSNAALCSRRTLMRWTLGPHNAHVVTLNPEAPQNLSGGSEKQKTAEALRTAKAAELKAGEAG